MDDHLNIQYDLSAKLAGNPIIFKIPKNIVFQIRLKTVVSGSLVKAKSTCLAELLKLCNNGRPEIQG